MKKEIGPNDAIDNDVVAAVYVDNFALRVFGMADSEDRSGKATHGTAKTFLVAANLLELLQVFDKANVSDSVSWHLMLSAHDVTKLTNFQPRLKKKSGTQNGKQQTSPRLSAKDGNLPLDLLIKKTKTPLGLTY